MSELKNEVGLWSVKTIAENLVTGNISSLEMTAALLENLKAKDEQINAFIAIDEKGALQSAKESDERRRLGNVLSPLDGVAVGLKDMILTKGFPTTAGSKILEGYVPPYDAFVTQKIRDSGAVIVGKLNLDEFAMGSSCETGAFGKCRNPWDLDRTPGGSSGGSAAAVAAGMIPLSLGTDTGGSIRQPAAFCGVVGIKPTYGRVSRFGVVAFASSLDQVGPFGRNIADAASLLEVISGFDERDSTSINRAAPTFDKSLKQGVKGLKIGVVKEFMSDGMDPEVAEITKNAIDKLAAEGAEIKEVSLPHTKYSVAAYYIIAPAEASSNLSRYDGIRFGPRLGEDGGLEELYSQTRGQLFGEEVKRRIMLGTHVLSAGYYDAYYLKAQKVRTLISRDFGKAFGEVDILIGPTTPTPAFKIGEKLDDPIQMYLNDVYTISANLAGIPGLSMPGGFTKAGLPVGIQLLAKVFDEEVLIRCGSHLEDLLSLGDKHPL